MATAGIRAGSDNRAMEFEHKVGALDDEDLVVGETEKKNWRGLLIATGFISLILGAILMSIYLVSPNASADTNRMKLEFDHVVGDAFKAQPFNGTWLSEHEIVYVDQNGSIVIFDARTNSSKQTSTMLVKTYDKTLHTMDSFQLSADRSSILFVSDVKRKFGATVSARYAIFNISSQTVEYLDDMIKANGALAGAARAAPTRASAASSCAEWPCVQYAAWAPTANSIVFIESNDIYYVPDFARASSSGNSIVRLTRTGALSEYISNGLPDLLYRTAIFGASSDTHTSHHHYQQELYGHQQQPLLSTAANPRANTEVAGSAAQQAALWWSPDGKYLAYLSFDDALVEPTPLELYDEPNGRPAIHYERYPRAGAQNPRVAVHVVDLSSAESSTVLQPPLELQRQQQADSRLTPYVSYVGWLHPSNELVIMWSNRAQNTTLLSVCDASTQPADSAITSLFSGSSSGDSPGSSQQQSGAWRCELVVTFAQRIPPSTNARRTILGAHNASGTRLIFFALPRPDSLIGDHYHVAMLRGEERAPKYLTHGEFDVDRLISYDSLSDTLYFEVTETDKAERHLYSMSQVGQVKSRQTKCVTCALQDATCGYSYAHVAPGPQPKYFVHECLGPNVPETRMRSLDEQSQYRTLSVLGTNPHIEQLVAGKQMPIEKYVAIKTNQNAPYDVRIKLYLPNEIDEEKDKKFPLLIESSEIDTRNVWKRFELDWGKYLTSRKQLVYARIDCIRRTRGASSGGSSGGSSTAAAAAAISYRIASAGGVDSFEPVDDQLLLDSPLFNAKDQIDVIKFIVDNPELFPYVDRRRIAIWGPTSTSAYVALATTASDDTKLIGCTVAVSPIVNWRYMNSYAAERYLGLPWTDSNALGYERTNLLKRAYEFASRKLLLVHGTADEQVHVQNSMQLMKALSEQHATTAAAAAVVGAGAGFMHQMQLYPDVGHSFEQVRRHYYMTLDGFIDRCFYQKPIGIKVTEFKKLRQKLY